MATFIHALASKLMRSHLSTHAYVHTYTYTYFIHLLEKQFGAKHCCISRMWVCMCINLRLWLLVHIEEGGQPVRCYWHPFSIFDQNFENLLRAVCDKCRIPANTYTIVVHMYIHMYLCIMCSHTYVQTQLHIRRCMAFEFSKIIENMMAVAYTWQLLMSGHFGWPLNRQGVGRGTDEELLNMLSIS